jgi:hypothetical protein
MRFSPGKLKQTITLFPKNLVKVGKFFYMQTFENIVKKTAEQKYEERRQ